MSDDIEIAEPLDYVLIDTLSNVFLTTKPLLENDDVDKTTLSLFESSLVQIIAYLTEVKFEENHFSTKTKEAVADIRKSIANSDIVIQPFENTVVH